MSWVSSSSLTFLTFMLMLTFSEVKSGQPGARWGQEESDLFRSAKTMNEGLGNGKIAFPKSQSRTFRKTRAAWTLPDPELEIVNNKLKVTLQSPKKIKSAFFYMNINEDFSKFKDADYKLKLKCKKGKLCRRRGGPLLQPGDVVYYGMIVKVKGMKGKQTFLGKSWIPFPETTTTVTSEATTEPLTGPPASGSCNVLSGSLPNGCAENVYTVPSGFPGTSSGRGNPERGFYQHTESKTSNWEAVDAEALQEYVAGGYTLIYRNIILDTFITSNISDAILQKIKDDFVTIRAASLKVILRFCYSIDQADIDDAAPLQLQKHIEQLAPILQENADVIVLMHVGFIGVWGEWYYTANYGNEGNISPEDYEKRRQVVFQLLDALPASRQVQLRTNVYKRTILERTDAITEDEAHKGTKVARIGHHNDCFLASDLDWGTYTDKAEEYPYLQNETLYVSQGGESCNLNPPRSDCPTALKELSELHYSYLNSGYHPDVLQSWKDEGCFDEVDSSLGYRLVGVLSRLPETVGVGSSTNVGLRVKNIGWSAPVNYRSAQLVLRHATTSVEIASPLEGDIDLRKWLPGEHDLSMTLTVPSSATPGEYKVLLRLPDGEASLKDTPEYNIVMENLDDSGDLLSRLNLLGTTTVV